MYKGEASTATLPGFAFFGRRIGGAQLMRCGLLRLDLGHALAKTKGSQEHNKGVASHFGDGITSFLQQRHKPRLFEMMIDRKGIDQPLGPHDCKTHAINQAPRFILPRVIQLQCFMKSLSGNIEHRR